MHDQQTPSTDDKRTSQGSSLDIDRLLRLMVNKGASDLHLKVPSQPVFRIEGELFAQEGFPAVIPHAVQSIFEQITTEEQRNIFYREL
jgi:twitching motility protein PilT